MKYKKIGIGFGFLIVLILISSLVNAFAVTTYYWEGKPVVIHPGETKEVYLDLQNMASGEDIILKGEITEGSEIATLLDDDKEYLVPSGRKDIKVNIKVEIPEDTPLESNHNIAVSFKEISKEEGKMLHLASGVGASIPVFVSFDEYVPPEKEPVKEEKVSFDLTTVLVMILIIVLIAIIGKFVLKKRTTKTKKRK